MHWARSFIVAKDTRFQNSLTFPWFFHEKNQIFLKKEIQNARSSSSLWPPLTAVLSSHSSRLLSFQQIFLLLYYGKNIVEFTVTPNASSSHQWYYFNQLFLNRSRSIYQYSNMAPRLSRQTSILFYFFVSKSLLRTERQKKLYKFAILTRKPRIHDRIFILNVAY